MQEMWVQSLGQEDPLEEEIATHPSILAWKIRVGYIQFMGPQKVIHDWACVLMALVDRPWTPVLRGVSRFFTRALFAEFPHWKCCFPHSLSVESDLSYPGKAAGEAVLRKEALPLADSPPVHGACGAGSLASLFFWSSVISHHSRIEQQPQHLSDRRHLLALGPIFSQTCWGHPSPFNNTQGGTENPCGASCLAFVLSHLGVWPFVW